MSPFFSVVIPLYNKAKHIEHTLNSVFAQAFSDYEVIVVDDGSTDDGANIVKTFKDTRLNLFSKENQGVSVARNYGVSKAQGQYIAFLDADDIWMPHHLQDLKHLIDEYPYCGLYCKAYEKDYFGITTIKGSYKHIPEHFKGIVKDYFSCSLIDSIAWTSAVAIPKDIFLAIEGFDPNLRSGQDTDLWIRTALKYHVAFDTKISVKRNITNTPHLSTSKNRRDRLKIIEKNKVFERQNPSLKIYLDYIRFAIILERKNANDTTTAKTLMNAISLKNLSLKQRLMLKLPSFCLKPLKRLQMFLIKNKIYLSPFR